MKKYLLCLSLLCDFLMFSQAAPVLQPSAADDTSWHPPEPMTTDETETIGYVYQSNQIHRESSHPRSQRIFSAVREDLDFGDNLTIFERWINSRSTGGIGRSCFTRGLQTIDTDIKIRSPNHEHLVQVNRSN